MSEALLAVVTGSSRGLGLATVNRLLADGMRVVGVSRTEPEPDTLHDPHGQYTHVRFDASEIDGIAGLAHSVVGEHGAPWALVNNAAVGADGLLPTMHNSDISNAIEVNLTSPIVFAKYFSRPMLARRRGRIVNVSSVVAVTGYRGLSVYAATKAGLQGFTRSLARDLGPRGVTVNCVAPGFLETDMTAALGEVNMDRIRRRAALNRFPTRDEVAGAVAYLLSDEAAGVTGTTLTVDAGNSA